MTTDPRDLGGSISGPGGPYTRGGVVVHTERALLLDDLTVALIDGEDEPHVALMLGGPINTTQDRADLLVVANADGVAALITQVIGLVERMDPLDAASILIAIENRRKAMP